MLYEVITVEGGQYPGKIVCRFPGAEAEMRFEVRQFEAEASLDDDVFDVEARLADVPAHFGRYARWPRSVLFNLFGMLES